jgi:hypothetical protein
MRLGQWNTLSAGLTTYPLVARKVDIEVERVESELVRTRPSLGVPTWRGSGLTMMTIQQDAGIIYYY